MENYKSEYTTCTGYDTAAMMQRNYETEFQEYVIPVNLVAYFMICH